MCGGCRIQFDRLSIVKHCCISDCTLCYVLSLTSNFVQAYMTQQHMILTTSTGTVVLVLVLGTEVLVLVLETWVLVLVLETQVLAAINSNSNSAPFRFVPLSLGQIHSQSGD